MTEKITDITMDKPANFVKVTDAKHFVGTFSDAQLKNKAEQETIDHLQSDKGFPSLKFVNHRQLASGKTEVWLSQKPGPFTIKA